VGLKENVILGHLIPAGTGFRQYQEAEVRYRPEALQAMQAEKDKVLETAFPLLQQAGDGNGKEGQAQPTAPKTAPTSLETLLGGKE
jgi:DNA-directed RNA polymerase subunit beta'